MTREPFAPTARSTQTETTRPHGRVNRTAVQVAASSIVTADAAEIARLRTDPGPAAGADLPNLRHADEQTVLAVAAVLRAASTRPLGPFTEWGVIAAPRWPGRFGVAAAIEKFHAVGVRGVGPQAIPNLCLHAAAATVSLAVAAHGPVYGTGGGPAHVADGLLAGLTAQIARETPGTWLVLTNWDGNQSDGVGRAVALALVPGGTSGSLFTLLVGWQGDPLRGYPGLRRAWSGTATPCKDSGRATPVLAGLAEFLARPNGERWDHPLDGGGELTLAAGDES
jgi:hypothetical protein